MKNIILITIIALMIPIISSSQTTNNSNKISTDSCYAYFEFTADGTGYTEFENLSVGTDSSEIISYFWNFRDGGSSSLLDPIHTYAITGVCACLTIEDITGCTDTYCYPNETGINNIGTLFNIYPNPSVSELTISITDIKSRKVNATITNYIGEIVDTKSFNTLTGSAQQITFNIQSYPSGIFYVLFYDEFGIIYKTKVIKL